MPDIKDIALDKLYENYRQFEKHAPFWIPIIISIFIVLISFFTADCRMYVIGTDVVA